MQLSEGCMTLNAAQNLIVLCDFNGGNPMYGSAMYYKL